MADEGFLGGGVDWTGIPAGKPPSAKGFTGIVDWTGIPAGKPSSTGFPTQFAGFRSIDNVTSVFDWSLVAVADAPPGVGQLRVRKQDGVTYVVYLVDGSDPDASPIPFDTIAGTKYIRRKT